MPTAAKPSDWTTYQCDILHTGYNRDDPIALPLQPRWSFRIHDNRQLDQVTVADGKVFVSTGVFLEPYLQRPGVRCFDAHTGELLWEHTCSTGTDCDALSQVTHGYGRIYFQQFWGPGSKLYALDAGTGVEDFRSPFSAQADDYLAPAVNQGMVVAGGGTYGGMYGWRAGDGFQVWQLDPTLRIQHDLYAPSILRDTVYVWIVGWMRALDLWTGNLLWQNHTSTSKAAAEPMWSSMCSAVVVDTSNRILFGIWDDDFHALDMDTHQFLWHKFGHQFQSLFPYRGDNPVLIDSLIIAVDSGNIVAYHGRTGDERWRVDYTEDFAFTLAAANRYLFASTLEEVMAIDLTTREIVWKSALGGHLSIANGWLYVATLDGRLCAYGPPFTDVEVDPTLPADFYLDQNYPNPFNPETEISFRLPRTARVRLEVFNLLGQFVATLVDEKLSPGEHRVAWHADGFGSGVYLYRLTAGEHSETKRMLLLK